MPVLSRTRPTATSESHLANKPNERFARLYDEFATPIFWYCRSRLGEETAAEDVTSTVFARALTAGPRYDDPSLRSWLFGIAHKVLADWFRAIRPVAPLEDASAVADRGPSPDDAVIAEEERERLLAALRLLPTDQRRVAELRMAGLTGPEIANVLDRSHGAVKMLQLRAYARLRELLADMYDEERESHG